jgi:hypothetical protein
MTNKGLRQKSNFLSHINADSTVHPFAQKYSALPVGQIISIPSRRPAPDRGASRSSRFLGAGCGGRHDVEKTNDMAADGEVVWS